MRLAQHAENQLPRVAQMRREARTLASGSNLPGTARTITLRRASEATLLLESPGHFAKTSAETLTIIIGITTTAFDPTSSFHG